MSDALGGLGTLETDWGHDAPDVPLWPCGVDPAIVIEAAPRDPYCRHLVDVLWLLWTVATVPPRAGQLTLMEVGG